MLTCSKATLTTGFQQHDNVFANTMKTCVDSCQLLWSIAGGWWTKSKHTCWTCQQAGSASKSSNLFLRTYSSNQNSVFHQILNPSQPHQSKFAHNQCDPGAPSHVITVNFTTLTCTKTVVITTAGVFAIQWMTSTHFYMREFRYLKKMHL